MRKFAHIADTIRVMSIVELYAFNAFRLRKRNEISKRREKYPKTYVT